MLVLALKVLRHELLFYGGLLQGTPNRDVIDKVGSGGGALLC